MPMEIKTDNFEAEVIRSEKPVLVDFWGPQCRPCLALMPQVDQLEKLYGAQAKFTKVDASQNRRLCLNLKVLSLPTFLFYQGGKEAARLSGDVNIRDIEESLKKICESSREE